MSSYLLRDIDEQGRETLTQMEGQRFDGEESDVTDSNLVRALTAIDTIDKYINSALEITLPLYFKVPDYGKEMIKKRLQGYVDRFTPFISGDFGIENPCQWSPESECVALTPDASDNACDGCDDDCDRAIAFKQKNMNQRL